MLDGFIRSLETVVDQAVVEGVKRELHRSADQLDGGRFQDLVVSESVFGGSARGAELGFHHGRAHQVISETIEGVIADIRDFREGVVRAEQMLDAADSGASGDLQRRRAAIEALEDANRWFAGDHRYETARHAGGGDA